MTGPDASVTSVTGQSGRWQTYLASAIGADHIRAGTQCQDAVGTETFGRRGEAGPFAFAVADGHGHARHFRSARGSRFAVDSAMAAARDWAAGAGRSERVSRAAADQLAADVVARWRAAVAADLAADPVAGPQLATIEPGDPAEIPYGSTLLLAVVLGSSAVLAQIGDGEMLLISPDGQSLSPVPEDARLDGTQTTSLCQLNAVAAFRTAVVDLARTHAFAIFAATDGFSNAQAREDWRPSLAEDLVRLGAERGTQWLGGQLDDWAGQCASAAGSGDDTSVALAFDTSAALAPPAIRPRSGGHAAPADPTLPVAAGPAGQADKTLLAPAQAPVPPPAAPASADRTLLLPGNSPGSSPGQTAPGQTAPGQTAPGQFPPGQLAPGQFAPGQFPQGQFPPGRTPPGGTPPGRTPAGGTPAPDRTLGLPDDWNQAPGGTGGSGTGGSGAGGVGAGGVGTGGSGAGGQGTGGGLRVPGGRGTLGIAALLVVVIAVVIYLLVSSGSHPSHGFAPSPSPTAAISAPPSPTPTGGSHGQQSAGSGKHHKHHKHPKQHTHTSGQGSL